MPPALLGLLLILLRPIFTGGVFLEEPGGEDGPLEFSNSTGLTIRCRGQSSQAVDWVTGTDFAPVGHAAGLREVLSDGSLGLAPFPPSAFRPDLHRAVYRCRLRGKHGIEVSRAVPVQAVLDQPLQIKMYDEYAIRGNTAVIRCLASPRPYVIVTSWSVSAPSRPEATPLAITNGGRYSVLRTGELHIRDVGPADGLREFRCRARHKLTGETLVSSSRARLIVTDPPNPVPPRITDSASRIRTRAGENVELPCAAQGMPAPTYRWYRREGSRLHPVVPGTGGVQQKAGSLFLTAPRDGGEFVCVVANTQGEERTSVILDILEPLRVVVNPGQLTAEMGGTADFNCTVSSGRARVSWLKDGVPLRTTQSGYRLIVPAVGPADRGVYQCLAEMGGMSAQGSAVLELGDIPPTLTETFAEQTLQPGPAVSLRCVATGSPRPQVTWTVDGEPLERSDRLAVGDYVLPSAGAVASYVNVSRVRAEDGGLYGCTARSPAGIARHSARLNVYGLPTVLPLTNRTVVAMETAVLGCRVTGYPLASVHWEKDGKRLPTNHRQRVYPNGTLEISLADPAVDRGQYTCVASSAQGHRSQGSRHLHVAVPPLVESFSFDRNLQAGMRTAVYCNVARGDPPVTVRWLKDGHRIEDVAADLGLELRQLDPFSLALRIPALGPRHNGNYTCVASNPAASVARTALLTVNVPPHWVVEPTNTYVVSGSAAVLHCRAEGYPSPQVTWKLASGDDETAFRQILSGPEFQVFENGTLRVTEAAPRHAGKYLCQAYNGLGAGLSTVVALTVHVPAHFMPGGNTNVTVRRGQEAELVCRASGDKPLSVTWSKEGLPLNSPRYSVRDVLTDDGLTSTLSVSSTQRQDTGLYNCLASNSFGQDASPLQLLVQEVPEAPPGLEASSVSSRSASLSWKAPYDGNAHISQYVVEFSAAVPPGAGGGNVTTQHTRVTLRPLHPSTTYVVRVRARNSIGVGPAADLRLSTAEEVPGGPPVDVKVTALGPRSLRVTWKAPESALRHGDIRGYYVGYRPHNGSEPFLYKTLERPPRLAVALDKLRPYTGYAVLVQAFNGAGAGPRSDPILGTTWEDVPPEAPANMSCESIGPRSLLVTWHPLAPETIPGTHHGYRVVIAELESKNTTERNTTDTRAVLEGLEPYTNYSVGVAGVSGAGKGTISTPHICRTAEDVPSAPTDLRVMVSGPEDLLVTWLPPERPNGRLTHYTVYRRTRLRGLQNTTALGRVPASGTLTYEDHKLTRGQRYEYWVTASTLAGEGPTSRTVAQTPTSRAPARSVTFPRRVTLSTGASVELPCHMVGLPPPRIEWSLGKEKVEESPEIQLLPGGALRVQRASELYEGNYTCTGSNSHGADSVTHELRIRTAVLPRRDSSNTSPSPVVTSATINSLTLAWEPPGRSYSLRYKADGSDTGWQRAQVRPGASNVTLTGLHCGTTYRIVLEAPGLLPSGPVLAKTIGGEPVPPRKEVFLQANVTSVTLHLDAWELGGCGQRAVTHFSVDYRPRHGAGWVAVSPRVTPAEGPMTLHELRPATWYTVRVTAHGGPTLVVAEYDVATLAQHAPSAATPDSNSGLYEDIALAVPLVSSVLVLAAVLGAVALLCRRRRAGPPGRKQEKKLSVSTVFSSPLRKVAPSEPASSFIKTVDGDDISPYATFHSPYRETWQPLEVEGPPSHRSKGLVAYLQADPDLQVLGERQSKYWENHVRHHRRNQSGQSHKKPCSDWG